MDICSSMFVRKKNIPPRNRGGLCRSRRDFSGAISVLIHAYSVIVFPGAAPDAPHQRCFDIPRHGAYRRAIAGKIPAPVDRDGGVLGVI